MKASYRACTTLAVALLGLVPAAPAAAELVANDSAFGEDVVVRFQTRFRETEWFAATLDVPEQYERWTLCRIYAWIGPNASNPFFVRMWDEPDGEPFDPADILWDTGDDAYQLFGSTRDVSVIDLTDAFLTFGARRVRVGFRHIEGWPAPPSIAADDDGFEPRRNHINAVVPSVDRMRQSWYTVDDLPEDDRPSGDFVVRVEVVGEEEACPEQGDVRPDVDVPPPEEDAGQPPPPAEGEGEGEGGEDPDAGTGPAPGRDASVGELSVDLVIPARIDDAADHPLAVFGDGFGSDAVVSLACTDCGPDGGPLAVDARQTEVRGPWSLHAIAPSTEMAHGFYDVTVRRPSGERATLPLAVEVVPADAETSAPVVDSVVPDEVPVGVPAEVIVKGTGFLPGASVLLDDLPLPAPEVLSTDRILVVVPAAIAAGAYDLTVVNEDGRASPPVPFRVAAPSAAGGATPSTDGCDCAVAGLRRPAGTLTALLRFRSLLALLLAPSGCAPPTRTDAAPGATVPTGATGRVWTVGPAGDHETIGEAVEAAAPGDAILLAAGEYAEDVVVDRALTLAGPDDGAAVLLGRGGPSALAVSPGVRDVTLARLEVRSAGDGVLVDQGASATLADLRVAGVGGVGVRLRGATVRVEGGEIERTGAQGLLAEGATVYAQGLVVRRTTAHGIRLAEGSEGTLDGVRVRNAVAAGIELDGSSGRITRAVVDGVVESEDTNTASCIAILDSDAEVVVAGARLSGCALRGVRVYQARARIEDSEVRGAALSGVSVTTGSEAAVLRNHISGSRGAAEQAGIGVVVDRSSATVQGNAITDSGIAGIQTEEADVVVRGNRVFANGRVGINVRGGAGAEVVGNRVDDHPNYGVFVGEVAGPVRIERNEVSGSAGAGIAVTATNDTLEVVGNTVRRTVALESDDADGEGIFLLRVTGPTRVHANHVSRNLGSGILLVDSVADLQRNTVADNGGLGVGVLGAPAAVRLEGNDVAGSAGAGIQLLGAEATLVDNVVSDTRVDGDTGQGEGLVLLAGARAELRGNTVRNSARNGLLLMALARATLTSNRIHDSGRYGVECLGAYATVGPGNVFEANAAGSVQGCTPPP